jgi:Glycosyl transferase family 2
VTAVQLPRISIVTPSFNQARFLEACIESVLSQEYPNLEYILMDGGSTDGSVEIIRKYERHLTYWQSQPDGGHYAAVADGFARATGDILAWLNSDDKYCPLAFFKVAHVFLGHPEASWITGRPMRWSADGRAEDLTPDPIVYSRDKTVLRGDFQTPWICQESTFWRRSLWERAGGGPRADLRLAGDLELWVRFFRYAPLHFLDTLLGGNRRHSEQRSVIFLQEYLREAETVLAEEVARPAPDSSFSSPEPLTYEQDKLRRFLRDSGVPLLAIAADELAMDLVADLGRVSAERDHFIHASRVYELALAESDPDRQARLDTIQRLEERVRAIERSVSWRAAMLLGRIVRPFTKAKSS